MCIIFHTLGNGYLKFGPDLRGNQTSIQDSLTIKRNCFCNFHWGPFRMYLSDINFGILCGFTSMVSLYYSLGKIISGKIVVKMCLDVCVLKNVLLNYEVLAHQYLLQFHMNLYA